MAILDATLADESAVVDVPDLEIREPYIEILDRESEMRVVTVIELVSPSNKYAGSGRDAYVTKQQEVRYSTTHLVEIDYHAPCEPPMERDDQTWAGELIRSSEG